MALDIILDFCGKAPSKDLARSQYFGGRSACVALSGVPPPLSRLLEGGGGGGGESTVFPPLLLL